MLKEPEDRPQASPELADLCKTLIEKMLYDDMSVIVAWHEFQESCTMSAPEISFCMSSAMIAYIRGKKEVWNSIFHSEDFINFTEYMEYTDEEVQEFINSKLDKTRFQRS